MAIYRDTNIPAVNKKHKEIIERIIFEGKTMDFGEANIQVYSIAREVDPDTLEPIEIEGEYQYVGVPEVIKTTLAEEQNIVIDGISTMQVFAWLSKWTDYKKGENVPGLGE